MVSLAKHILLLAALLAQATVSVAQGMDAYQAKRAQMAHLHTGLIEGTIAPSEARQTLGLDHTNDVYHTQLMPAGLPVLPEGIVDLIDLRLALVQLSFAVGSNEQLSVFRAQNSETPLVLAVQEGKLDLADLKIWISKQPNKTDLLVGDTFQVPVVVFGGAGLNLHQDDLMLLERSTGSFLANFGELFVDGATIAGVGDVNPKVQDYRPFVVSAGAGFLRAKDSIFSNLGFGETAAFSGLSTLNRGLFRPKADMLLHGSRLSAVKAITVEGTTDAVVKNNMLLRSTGVGLDLRSTQSAAIVGNLLIEPQGTSAIRIGTGSIGTHVSGNLILQSAGSGILVNKASHATTIAETVVWQSAGSGITVSKSDCALLTGNVMVDSSKKGIELRTSRGSAVIGNMLYGNQSAGLSVSDQTAEGEMTIHNNIFAGNRVGIASASSNLLALSGNNLVDQFPRFVGGDLVGQVQRILPNLRGDDPVVLKTGALLMTGLKPQTCASATQRG